MHACNIADLAASHRHEALTSHAVDARAMLLKTRQAIGADPQHDRLYKGVLRERHAATILHLEHRRRQTLHAA